MASKGQKFKSFSNEERTIIIEKYLSGKYSYYSLAKEHNISKNTIATIIRKYHQTGLTTKDKRGVPKTKDLSVEDWKERYEIVKKYQAFLKAQQEKK